VIVVVASPRALPSGDGRTVASGLGSEIALAAAAIGATVQVVGRVGEDPDGEAVLLHLAQRGVGHIAVLRDAGRPTREQLPEPGDPGTSDAGVGADAVDGGPSSSPGRDDAPTVEAADLQLALSYLPDYRVVVIAEPLDSEAMRVAANAVGWAGSALVVIGRAGDLAGLPDDATVFEPPDDGDPDGAFAAMVGAYAAGLDRGDDPRATFEAAAAAVGSTASE
jgi:hypothetical protein